MTAYAIRRNAGDSDSSTIAGVPESSAARVLVCVDKTATSRVSIPPAKAIARALNAQLELVHVIEPRRTAANGPFDPVEWEFTRREAERTMSRIASEHGYPGTAISTRILEGQCAEQIRHALNGGVDDVAVLCRGGDQPGPHVGETVRRILETGSSSILIVPEASGETAPKQIARIFVPLDGSGQSESAIPFALKIAASENAEIVLFHATPEPGFTQVGPAEPGDEELRQAVNRRNERVARKYLDRLCAHVRAGGVKVRALVLQTGDVRRAITSAVSEQSADLLVIASHGHSGFTDVPLGDVANFVLSRSAVPVLMVRRPRDDGTSHVFTGARAKGVRRPAASAQ